MKYTIIELDSNIGYQCSRNFKATYDGVPDELSNVVIFDRGINFNFYPLGEIIYGYKEELLLLKGYGERPYDVELPLGERPWANYRIEQFGQ